jgi:manganese oxidase
MDRWTGTSRYARLDRRTVIIATVVAYGVGLWTHAVHWRSGAREAHDVTFWPHWLRDSTMSVPLVLLAVLAATMAVGQRARIVRTASAVAASVAAALALGVPVHAGIFGHAAHHGAVPALPVSMAAEFLIDLPVALLLTAALLGLGAVRWPARRALRTRERVAVAMAALFTVGIITIPSSQASAVTPPSVCSAGAITRTYDVTIIDIDIPLNRWGDHDPAGKMYALTSQIPAIRAEEASREVSLGLRDDPIQPLVIRANEGDCVEITVRNSASGGTYGLAIDGLPFDRPGDKVGKNFSGEVPSGQVGVFRYFVPNEIALEGAHYISPGAGHRAAIDHGLFGVLSVEPPGSRWLSPKDATTPIESGWEAIIWPQDALSFREDVQILHEIGNEKDNIYDKNNKALPTVDPITEAYRPGSRGINYRAEPFMNRLNLEEHEKSHAYSSSMFGDPATIIPQGYLGDPTKFRVVHGGAELFHIYHLHGGGDRWRANPEADPTNYYADTGLHKEPVEVSNSDRVDAVNTGPGESFNAEIEGGAGGVQQAAGDFLFHCHIAEHYPSGMWGLWRVFDTLQPGLAPLPDRLDEEWLPPTAVTSDQLIGKQMPDGTILTKDNLAAWIAPQLPPQGIAIGSQDAAVWDWTVDNTNPEAPVYLGEPEPTFAETPNFTEGVPGHFGSRPGDLFVGSRPEILFNPYNGRPAWPMIRPHLDRRPPFAANLHTGTPWLGETADVPPTPGVVDPWAAREDGLCPAAAPINKFNVVAVQTPVDVTPRKSDPGGLLFTLAENKDALLAGQMKKEPLAIRMNVGECGAITLTSEETDKATFGGFAKVEMHIHHVQFDPSGSDGTSIGYSFEHSIRPYTIEDTKLAVAAAKDSTSVTVNRIDPKYRPGVAFGVGLGKDSIEEATIVSVNAATKTIVLDRPLASSHAAGEGAGIEFIRYRWYADALLDNIFWHDHVDGIHGWGHGGVGMLIIEPKGSTYHDPTTGDPVRSGNIVDIHSHPYIDGTYHPLAKGLVEGSFREMVIWTIDDNPVTDSTINLHAAPFSDRGTDPSLRFSSYKYGDPTTPLLRAYPGDPVVIRAIHVGPTIDSFRVDGHHFFVEKRNETADGIKSRVTDTIHSGVSERYTLILDGGAGGISRQAGDYLYHNGIARRFRQGAWGILRVLPKGSPGLQPLPDNAAPPGTYVQPAVTNSRPPATVDPGNPCPADSTPKAVAISAVDVPNSIQGTSGSNGTSTSLNGAITAAYVMTSNAAVAKAKGVTEPLVVHVNLGDCLTINFTNQRKNERASMAIGELDKSGSSSGVNVGFTSEQTVAPGASQTYRVYADTLSIESAVFSDFGGNDTGKIGLYGAIVIGEKGAWFTNPTTGAQTMSGALVDVHVPGQPGYRDNTLFLQDNDPQIGADFMPYPIKTDGLTLVNYKNAGRRTDDFSGTVATPLLQAYVGDPMKIHVLSTPGSEQPHVFRAGGLAWLRDPYLPASQEVAEQGLAPYQGIDVHLIDGAGGRGKQTGDFFYGDNRRAFTESGMWGVLRVLPKPSCTATTPIRRLDGAACT